MPRVSAGFWCMEDLTRPFVSQAVITDGRYFSFFCYQLNTLALTVQTDAGNPRKNVSWGTDSLPLYQGVSGDKVDGLDDGVLRLLLQFLLNRPQPTWRARIAKMSWRELRYLNKIELSTLTSGLSLQLLTDSDSIQISSCFMCKMCNYFFSPHCLLSKYIYSGAGLWNADCTLIAHQQIFPLLALNSDNGWQTFWQTRNRWSYPNNTFKSF